MASSNTSDQYTYKRGPYKRYLRDPNCVVPRQTRYNWRKAEIDPTPLTTPEATAVDSPPASSADEEQDYSSSESDDIEDMDTDDPSPTSSLSLHASLGDGAPISDEMGMMLILSLLTKHRLTYSALEDILKVVSEHLPSGSVPSTYKSMYHLQKAMSNRGPGDLTSTKILHQLCGKCQAYIESGTQCQNLACQLNREKFENNLFYELPVDAQIKQMFEGTYYI